MNYSTHHRSKYVVAKKEGNYPIVVVAGTHFPSLKRAEKKARSLNDQWKLRPDIKFVIRKEGWNRKRWYS